MKDTNPVRKEKFEHLKNASSLPFGKRMRYYFDFFKFPLLGILIVGILVFFFVKEVIFAPEVIFYGVIVNRTEVTAITDDEFIRSFPEYGNYNTKREKIYFSSDMFFNDSDIESAAKLIANASSGDINVMICNKDTFDRLSQAGLFADLDNYPELKAKYSDSLLSYDHTKNATPEDDSLGIKTYGIDISDSAVLKSLNAFHEDEKTYLCIGLNSNTSDVVLSFIDWIAP